MSPTRNELLADAAWLRRRYEDDGATVAEIATEAGADASTVHLWLQRHEIPRRSHEIDEAELRRLVARRKTVAEIAEHYDVDRGVIYDRLYRLGLRRVSTVNDRDAAQLRDWYERQGWSLARIAEELGISRRAVTRMMLAAGIEVRRAGR
jgi:predicted DNA-binding protein YlxM (UPF0122 family)